MRRSIVALLSGSTVLGGQQPASYSYDFRAVTGDERPVTGTVRVSGSRARIDVASGDRRGDRRDDGQYFLVSDNGRTFTVVNPRDRTYGVYDSDKFAHVASIGIGAAGKFLTLKMRESSFRSSNLGTGDPVAGRATVRAGFVERWRMEVGALGITNPGEPEEGLVETEFWFDPGLTLMRNPLFELLATTATVLPATDPKYAAKADSVRRSLVRGTPLKTVVTEHKHDGTLSRTVLEVTRFDGAGIDAHALLVPDGYTRTETGLSGFKLRL